MPESAIVQLVRILGPHPSDPGSSPGGGMSHACFSPMRAMFESRWRNVPCFWQGMLVVGRSLLRQTWYEAHHGVPGVTHNCLTGNLFTLWWAYHRSLARYACCWQIPPWANLGNYFTNIMQGPHRLVVRTSRRGRDNPGSTPGVDNNLDKSRNKVLQIAIRSRVQI